jgi:hypothetical protein
LNTAVCHSHSWSATLLLWAVLSNRSGWPVVVLTDPLVRQAEALGKPKSLCADISN